MKFILSTFVLFALSISQHFALNAENYIAYIEQLSRDDTFLDEYAKWSLKLFSQPDYLYGDSHRQFPCPIKTLDDNVTVPVSVHSLRPSDVKCVAAMGDSLTTGLGAHALTPNDLLFENRGLSWSIGGDYTYSKVLSIPNILRQYNSNLKGFSTQASTTMLIGQNASQSRLNVAKSGDSSIHMPYQAELLIDRLKTENICDWANDWKMITIFVGGNDLCSLCENSNVTKTTPEQYMTSIRDTLDTLYNASIPRTLINLVLALDVRGVKDFSSSSYICQVLLKKTCPCAALPTLEQAKLLDDYISRYHEVIFKLVHSGRYENRDDFTVVIQPFMVRMKISYTDDNEIDFSYYAPDCFHFSGKGHSQAALSLWNNMLEPVGGKQLSWHIGESLKCPTDEYPYIFTSKNSAKALVHGKRTKISQTSRRITTVSSSTAEYVGNTSVSHHRHRKNDKSDSSKMRSLVITGFIFIIIIIIIAAITKRQHIRLIISGTEQRHFKRFDNSQDADDNGEVEIWKHPNIKSSHSDNQQTTATHGTRLSFE